MTPSFQLPIRALTALTFFPLLNFAAPAALAEGGTAATAKTSGQSDAANPQSDAVLEEIVVTGTNIRGVAPSGSELMEITQAKPVSPTAAIKSTT